MAATPPMQLTGSPRTPSTPLHGAAYDHEDSPRRTSARLRQKRAFDEIESQPSTRPTRMARTPNSPRRLNTEPQSPERTPQRKSFRRVQVMSPTSPDSDTSAPKPSNMRASIPQPFLSATTALNEGMLPTPVKTPSKKHKTINKSNIAARALFQDQVASEEMAPSPRRNKKNKRFNGFSLESFRAEDGESRRGIQIFTDSRDQVPEVDKDSENPFIEHEAEASSSKKVPGTTKRRKVSEAQGLDPQVEEALRDDDGMVYVFRGKKVYRRFDDTGDIEEEIDADDLGLLQNTPGGARVIRPLKTMTRRSIKPTRLFQTEAQKRARELEKEEEAATDIEEPDSKVGSSQNQKSKGKKGSPFDSWARVKPGSASASTTRTTRGRKRAASESLEEAASTKV